MNIENIKIFSDCEECIHENVCIFKINHKEIVQNLTDYVYNNTVKDLFDVTVKCKEYIKQTPNVKGI